MIYTIGKKDLYLECYHEHVKRGAVLLKASGGSVWKTAREARSHAREGYAVFGVDADWDKETLSNPSGDWHDLTVNAPIIILGEI